MDFLIQEAHPLKQGLKRWPHPSLAGWSRDSRGTSTKTRIETIGMNVISAIRRIIQEAHPLKQGLKLHVRQAERR